MSGLSVAELESQYGDELRQPPFKDMSGLLLRKQLAARRPAVQTTHQAHRTWVGKYYSGGAAPGVSRSAAASMASGASAGASASSAPVPKRAPSAAAPSGPASSSGAVSVKHLSAAELEFQYGAQLRE